MQTSQMSSSQNTQLEGHSASNAALLPGQTIGNGPPPLSNTPTPARHRRKPANRQTPNAKPAKSSTNLRTPAHTAAQTTRLPTKKPGPTEDQKRAKRLLKRMQKSHRKESRSQLVFIAARATIAILKNHGLSCAMFGSLACRLYGEFRDPKDVDVLVLQPPTNPGVPPYSDEDLKKLIADTDPNHYYLKLPRDPSAPYRILYYHDDQSHCKIDILTPGTMHLPPLPSPSQNYNTPTSITLPPPPPQNNPIITIANIPLVPFPLLLLHKLQGWSDHRSAPEQFKQHKQHQDAADIRRLLAMTDLIKPLQRTRPWTNNDLFSQEFQALSRQRVKDYCKEFPTRAGSWKALGFEIE